DLFGTRASCSRFIANQFRLLLAALAYTLMQRLRELALKATELERASAATIRVRLLKIGAAILRIMLCLAHKIPDRLVARCEPSHGATAPKSVLCRLRQSNWFGAYGGGTANTRHAS